MLSSNIDAYIFGEHFQKVREQRGKSRSDLALLMCCSVAQIEQIEQGGLSCFYSGSHKLKTAQRIAQYLQLNPVEAFVGTLPELKNQALLSLNFAQPAVQSSRFSLASVLGLGLVASVMAGYAVYALTSLPRDLYSATIGNMPYSLKERALIHERKLTEPLQNTEVINSRAAQDPCWNEDLQSPVFVPATAQYSGSFIVLMSKATVSICIIDAKKTQQLLEMAPGQRKVVYGEAPFRLISTQLHEIDSYYQGMKVTAYSENVKSILLQARVVESVSPLNTAELETIAPPARLPADHATRSSDNQDLLLRSTLRQEDLTTLVATEGVAPEE